MCEDGGSITSAAHPRPPWYRRLWGWIWQPSISRHAIEHIWIVTPDESSRRLDIELLWPTCCKLTTNLDDARAVFAIHARHDPAWEKTLGVAETIKRIEVLPWISK